MTGGEDDDREARIARLQAFLVLSPLHHWLGCRITELDEPGGALVIDLPYRDELRRSTRGPAAHGGVVAALVDVSAHAAMHAQTGHGMPTIDLRVDYLRPAELPLRARATVRRNGRTIGNVDVEVFDGAGKLVATGRAVFLTSAPKA